MRGPKVKDIREKLEMTQADFSRLIGLHAVTLSRIENDHQALSPYHEVLVTAFGRAVASDKDIGKEAVKLFNERGIIDALYILLRAARKAA